MESKGKGRLMPAIALECAFKKIYNGLISGQSSLLYLKGE